MRCENCGKEIEKGKEVWVKFHNLFPKTIGITFFLCKECAMELYLKWSSNRDIKPIPLEVFEALRNFLLSHEYDIAVDWEDFGELKDAFEWFVGREPKAETFLNRFKKRGVRNDAKA